MRLLCLFSCFFSFIFALSVGFNYSYKVPKEAFFIYDWLIIHPEVKTYKTSTKLIAYISIGEKRKKINKNWVIGKNKNWKSYIMDIRNKDYQKYLLKQIKKYSRFDGFFFDTLDSYYLTKVNKSEYKKALISFFKKIKKLYPKKIIIFNRGFELIDSVKPTAIVAENLFKLNSKKISKQDRNWLINNLNRAKKEGIKAIVIEYVEPFNKEKAIQIAKNIKSLGFIPYVSDKYLYKVGVSNRYLIPRKILVVYDQLESKRDSFAHNLVAMPLEFFGYSPRVVSYKKLPKDTSTYAYIIVVFANGTNSKKFKNWLIKEIKAGKKVLFLGGFGFDDLSSLGIETFIPGKQVLWSSKLKEFEAKFKHTKIGYTPKDAIRLLTYKSDNGFNVVAAKTKWGGYFINPFSQFGDYVLWRADPFKFIPYILDFKNYPLPDFTTENGSRIWYSHIDGDGFVNRNPINNKFATEMLYEKIFKKYNLPFSESIIIAEVSPKGPYPKESKKALKLVKKIFKLRNLEPAVHAYSHPFNWRKKPIPHLPVKGYKFSSYQEVVGSTKILSKWIKKKVNLLFWTGECNPTEKVLGLAYKHHILSINGEDTFITYDKKFLDNIAPLGMWVGKYFQVNAQIANENIFTDLWKNKLGYVKAIQTIKLTENPRRLKPINIYFHNYSGAYPQSLWALKKVIDYSISKRVVPMFTSSFIKIALDFENSILLKDLEGKFYFINNGNLRTLKIKGKKEINIKKSKGVVGFNYEKGYTYISLDNSKKHKIVFGKKNSFYLIWANKRLIYHSKGIYKFDNRFGKLKVKFFLSKRCRKYIKGNVVRIKCK